MSIIRYIILLCATLFASSALAEPPPLRSHERPERLPGARPISGLAWAGLAGDEALVKELIGWHVDVNGRDQVFRRPMLHWAIEGGSVGAVQALLSAGADMEARSHGVDSVKAVAVAVDTGDPSYGALLALLSRGADPNDNLSAFHSPLWRAVGLYTDGEGIGIFNLGALKAVRYLMTFGADPTAHDTAVLHTAVRAPWQRFDRLRLELFPSCPIGGSGCPVLDVNDENWRGRTPLVSFLAGSDGVIGARDPRVLEWLLERGADINVMVTFRDMSTGEVTRSLSPLDYAVDEGLTAVADVLRAHIAANSPPPAPAP